MATSRNLKVTKNADGTVSMTFDPRIILGKSKGKKESDIVASSGGFSDLDGVLAEYGCRANLCVIK